MALKYSRQRETIKDFIMNRYDHPTADIVYMNVRKSYPRISLGTVYRNLNLLADIGDISRICIGGNVERYEANTAPHCHFICNKCGKIIDLTDLPIETFLAAAGQKTAGRIDHCVTYFYGRCDDCLA